MLQHGEPLDLHGLLHKLTLEEKVRLLAGEDWWRTATIDRDDIFVPHVKVSVFKWHYSFSSMWRKMSN
jgi:hypothetical protein